MLGQNPNQVFFNPQFGYYTGGSVMGHNLGNNLTNKQMWDSYVRQGYIKPIGGVAASGGAAAPSSAAVVTNANSAFVPNAINEKQLAGFSGGASGGSGSTIPYWMQLDYAQKMADLGGDWNGPIPYQLTDSSFRGGAPIADQGAALARINAAITGQPMPMQMQQANNQANNQATSSPRVPVDRGQRYAQNIFNKYSKEIRRDPTLSSQLQNFSPTGNLSKPMAGLYSNYLRYNQRSPTFGNQLNTLAQNNKIGMPAGKAAPSTTGGA